MEVFSPLHPLRVKRLSQYIARIPGLILYAPFEEATGTTVYNYAPADVKTHNGTINGTGARTQGKLGSALNFDGTGDFVEVSGLTFPTTSFSAGLLLKRTQDWTNGAIMDWRTDTGGAGFGTDGFRFYPAAASTFFYHVLNGTSVDAGISSGAVVTVDVWHMIVVTYQVNQAKIFVNGSQVGSTDTSVTMTESTSSLIIGGTVAGAASINDTQLQHAFVTTSVLSTAQIVKMSRIAGTS